MKKKKRHGSGQMYFMYQIQKVFTISMTACSVYLNTGRVRTSLSGRARVIRPAARSTVWTVVAEDTKRSVSRHVRTVCIVSAETASPAPILECWEYWPAINRNRRHLSSTSIPSLPGGTKAIVCARHTSKCIVGKQETGQQQQRQTIHRLANLGDSIYVANECVQRF